MTASVLELDGMTVPVEVARSSRRATLTIERDGSLRMRAAPDVGELELQNFLASKRQWIYRKLAEKEALHYEPVTKELVDGEGFHYLGRSYRLRIAETPDDQVRLHNGRLVLPSARVNDGYQAIIAWYRNRGTAWLGRHMSDWAARLRVDLDRLEVADLGHRWGAADAIGRVRIHWATMQLRPTLVDYILTHELAHLREPHHGPAFWQLLGRVMPDYDDRKAELARVGAQTWLGARHDLAD